jgi:regulatory protein YycI of two-component signal transduction system YycFG
VDWSRAKSILIIAFLLLNIVLGYQLLKGSGSGSDLPGDMPEETNKLLRSKNIQLNAVLPTDTPRLREITVTYNDQFKNEKVMLQEPIRLNAILSKFDQKESETITEIPKFDAYQHDPVSSKEGVYVLNQMYNQLPLFDVRLELDEKGGEIVSYKQAYVDVQQGDRQKEEQKVIPAYVALRTLIEKYLLEGSTINDVRLGYHGQMFNSQVQYMVPYWRVTTGKGSVYYIHAFNGAVDAESKDPGKTIGTNGDKSGR